MSTVLIEDQLLKACHVIFGNDLHVSREFLEYLQISGIKKAYRKKALEFHPDKVALNNLFLQRVMAERFISVQQAYEKLLDYLAARDQGFRFAVNSAYSFSKRGNVRKPGENQGNHQYEKTGRPARPSESFQRKNHKVKPTEIRKLYQGPVPDFPLLFGRYLYYTGIISFELIGQALVWQRSQRPRIGDLGCQLGMLSKTDALRVLRQRQSCQLFGETALSLGLLSADQLNMLLYQQNRLHKRFGEFFLHMNLMSPDKLREYIVEHQRHNVRVRQQFTQFA